MKQVKIVLGLIFFAVFTAIPVNAHRRGSRSSEERGEYECGNKFYRYRLDHEPAEYGFSAGFYAPGKRAFVGLSVWRNIAYHVGRIQLHPPGIELCNVGGPSYFSNDSSQIWYLYKNRRHHYEWVNSSAGRTEPFAIEVGSDNGGFNIFIGRIKEENKPVIVGIVVQFMGVMYYVDHEGRSKSATSGYQVLTCKSRRREKRIIPPKFDTKLPANVDPAGGCVHSWIPYTNDNAPASNGVSAGEYDCGNVAYIGKSKDAGVYIPGRIQISAPSGFYSANSNQPIFASNGSLYLVNKANYTYRWENFDGKGTPSNAVLVRNDVGAFTLAIPRVIVNGRVRVGKFLHPVSPIADDRGIDSYYEHYQMLVCDPWPKFQCSQQWNAFDASQLAIHGLSVDGGVTFVGRGTCKCINNGCDFGVGAATASDGVTFLDDLTATSVNSNNSESDVSPEYLVRDAQNTYKWAVSSDGVQVANAIELHSEGHVPFYIGTTRVDDRVFVGKVRPCQGLFFVDAEGRQRTTNAYSVLTCFSPDPSNGVWEKKSDASWLNEHWCPAGKEWNLEEMKCAMSEEMSGIIG